MAFPNTMPIFSHVCIAAHTTSSTPQPHILYILKVTQGDGSQYQVLRRYSEFTILHTLLLDTFVFPAKHTFITNLVPSAWANDELINERKKGLSVYLHSLLSTELQNHPVFVQFLTPGPFTPFRTPQIERNDPTVQMESKSLATLGVDPTQPCALSRAKSDQDSAKITDSEPIAAAYYPSWAVDTLKPEQIVFSKFDIIFFAFVTTNGVAGIDWDDGSKNALKRLVAAARTGTNKTRVVISMGGWSGCHWMSQAMSTASNRTKLCDALVRIVNDFGIDGVDIDWEYPNDTGSGNPHSPADSANLLGFIKLLRGALGQTRIISAAVTHIPWKGADGKPLKSVTEFARYMTFVNIMNYDVFGASEKPGPNAPLENGCGTSSQPDSTAKAAFAQWTKAGMPASKLLLGMPLYGYVSRSSANKLSGSFSPLPGVPGFPPGAHPRYPPKPINTNRNLPAGDLSRMWGQQIAFNQLLSSGVLYKKPDETYDGAIDYKMAWDDCSDTPYLFNQSRTTVITYDDTWSLMDKAKFAKESGMGGCFTWSLDQDDGIALHNVIRAGLGKK
ncbi:glycoside hydrolase family 18 protein [Macrolepiota fuliginosa MF-IS2]|uniref:Glycoside hydrolase family 18 protein n=1 Tax=Macrolepiota fuliginosa MF-IS2 TaxID=1400762 RepID=A0A9P6BZI9_9AGAR|nr:glycoside hydrolase family 18 protein [Macrolepiota fuliginosa MF-IS2]